MSYFRDSKRIVVKVGTSTLTHSTGHLNLRRIEKLVKVLSDMKNWGMQVVLVSSGAVSAGMAKIGFGRIPSSPEEKQAMAAVGQSELMKIYDRFFSDYGHTVAQILMTKEVLSNPERRAAAENTFRRLLEMNCIPVVNENDSVSVEEIVFGDNDNLSAIVASLVDAQGLIILTDIDGYYDDDPRENPDARLIHNLYEITDQMINSAGGGGTSRGTGGMRTKLEAAKFAGNHGIETIIMSGENPKKIFDLFDGHSVGTHIKLKGN